MITFWVFPLESSANFMTCFVSSYSDIQKFIESQWDSSFSSSQVALIMHKINESKNCLRMDVLCVGHF
jgi:hypothetical protein